MHKEIRFFYIFIRCNMAEENIFIKILVHLCPFPWVLIGCANLSIVEAWCIRAFGNVASKPMSSYMWWRSHGLGVQGLPLQLFYSLS